VFFSMPYLPEVSVNHSHTRSRHTGQPVLKREAQVWKNVLRQKVAYWIDEHHLQLAPGQQVIIRLDARFSRRPGQKPDGDNFLKLAQDSIADAFGVGQRGDWRFLAQVASVSHNDPEGELIYEVLINAQETETTQAA
jgi:Holliday junction resolvase RusA-like endonuclease